MQSNYLIVDRRILPDYYEKVVQARDMLREGRVKEVSEAVKLVGISRSTYYKYKDYIFAPSNETACKKAVFAFMLSHQQGVLSEVLNKFSELGANILTITQSLPIHGNANVVISVDMTNMTTPPDGIMEQLMSLRGVRSSKLIAIE